MLLLFHPNGYSEPSWGEYIYFHGLTAIILLYYFRKLFNKTDIHVYGEKF